jgi:N-acetylglucosamine-6-phosphate deacetylase
MGLRIFVDEHVAYREDRQRFAGSILTMAGAVRFMVQQVGVDLATAVHMAATVPAALLGLSHRKGALAPGMDADVVVLDEQLQVRATICRGVLMHGAML